MACIKQKRRYKDKQNQTHMDYMAIIDKFYAQQDELRNILLTHSRSVADKALAIADAHPELPIDRQFVEEAAMLHDIGVFLCNAPGIQCFGDAPYICHGTLGAELIRAEGYPRHALVCERHTGAGLTLKQIEERDLPIPHRELMPETLEEQLVCFADKFFSKTRLATEKTVEQAYASVAKHGEDSAQRFRKWCEMFL